MTYVLGSRTLQHLPHQLEAEPQVVLQLIEQGGSEKGVSSSSASVPPSSITHAHWGVGRKHGIPHQQILTTHCCRRQIGSSCYFLLFS